MERGLAHILIVDDDRAFRVATAALLKDEGYGITAVTNGEEARKQINERRFDLILSDLVMEGMNGIDLLQYIKQRAPDATVIMVTGFGSVQTAVEAMRYGAYDYLTKPCNNDELLIKVRRALKEREKSEELERLRDLLESAANFSNIISQNSKMKEVFKLVRQVAGTDVTVLVLGETGTGKELIAKALHLNSPRREKPFVVVQCSAIPETLLESELFGYERGAFTGAVRQRMGKFQEAEGGTIFLDEIADIPLDIQTKLLRILQDKQVSPIGGNATLTADVRIVAASNRDLDAMAAQGKFRDDLLYRLNVFPIMLPPLRERLDDIPLLAEYFLQKHQALARQPIGGFSPSVVHAMMNYGWKGNVREMENLIKRAIIKTDTPEIISIELPSSGSKDSGKIDEPPVSAEPASTASMPYKEYLEHVTRDAEEKYLLRILRETKGNLNQAARTMNVDRKTVYRKIEEYGIDVSKFKG
ncbi:MAG: sigma-54-dependent Fis family transcriptional regulator [Ignavibacteria bacterium]|nr:MAG: sigma-54-dependent Fis family transcriptional regulator [Ignavibacteria bacterium]